MDIHLTQTIPKVFHPVHKQIRSGGIKEVVAKGGRGSGKSSYLSLEVVYQLLRHPDCHAVVLRKVAGTLRNSVYNQIVWAIDALGCTAYFRCTVSPMECTYLPTGQKILFFGLDDAGKLKSLKLPFGSVGICWFEELDQFDGPEEVVAKGGRGSGKSSYLSLEVVYQLLRHPDCHAVVLRKVAGTLRNSVYNQIVWAIDALGCTAYFRCTVSPMECTYLPTGQKILFFGLDDAGKLKSLKLPFGSVGICWFEELDQFDGPEEVRNVEQSIFRGGQYSLTLKSFNPPAMARSWVNRYAREPRDGKLVHHSTYRDLPPALLGERFWADAEHLRATNPEAYRHEYGGEVVGSGAAVFGNLRLRAVPDDEILTYDRIYHGVDWGWWPDPWAYNACAYDPARRRLVIFDELTRFRTPNAETARLLIARGVGGDDGGFLIADGAEPKSCADYRAAGLPCRAARKGPGSLRESMKWLQGLAEIVIDPARCPDTAREFCEYEYAKDERTGEVFGGFVDAGNHHIDAVRYSLEFVWRRRGA